MSEQQQCPHCGARFWYTTGYGVIVYECGTVAEPGLFVTKKDAKIDCVKNQLRAAEARAEVAIAWRVDVDFRMGADIVIHKIPQSDGPDLYAVRAEGSCLNKEGHWEWEPQPSSRDEEFIARCRFATYDEALQAYKQKAEAEQEGAGNAERGTA